VAVPFQTLRRLLVRITGKKQLQAARVSVGRVVWAVEVVSRYMPGVKCLARALATQALRQYSHQAHIRIGVARSQKGSYKPTPG